MNFIPDQLLKAEQDFAAKHGVAVGDLKRIHDLRQTEWTGLSDTRHKIAVWIISPILTAFVRWIDQQAGQSSLLGVMREGRMLCRLMQTLFNRPTQEIWLNRSLSMLAAFGCGDDEALINWLVRTRLSPITHTEAAQRLLEKPYEGSESQDPIDLPAAYRLIEQWKTSGLLNEARQRAGGIADRLLIHWQQILEKTSGDGSVSLMDFACAGNIQRSLQTILKARKQDIPVIGLNFLTTAGSQWAEQKGCVMHGYLAEKGQPEWLANAYARSPELMEIFTASSEGPLKSHTVTGEAVCGKGCMSEIQKNLLNDMQKDIISAAAIYHKKLGSDLSRSTVQCILGRFLLAPTLAEVQALADWPLDAGLDGVAQRWLAPIMHNQPEPWTKMQTGWPAGSRRRTKYN